MNEQVHTTLAMASTLLATYEQEEPHRDGIQANSHGLQPTSKRHPIAMAPNLLAMVSNLLAKGTPIAMASNLLAMVSNLRAKGT